MCPASGALRANAQAPLGVRRSTSCEEHPVIRLQVPSLSSWAVAVDHRLAQSESSAFDDDANHSWRAQWPNDQVRHGDLIHPCGHRFSCSEQLRGSPLPRPACWTVRQIDRLESAGERRGTGVDPLHANPGWSPGSVAPQKQSDRQSLGSSINSSGVQIVGNSYPSDPATARSDGSVCALAMCAQFHVKRKSIPCRMATAMCEASVAALAGMAPEARRASAMRVVSSSTARTRRSLRSSQRRRATSGSPSAASSHTNGETKSSKRCARNSHRGGMALLADFFQQRLEFGDAFRVAGGDVVLLLEVGPEVVEFGGLVVRAGSRGVFPTRVGALT
jgi:hypothetical protein